MTNALADYPSSNHRLVSAGAPGPAMDALRRLGVVLAVSLALAACGERAPLDARDPSASDVEDAALDQPVEEVPPATAPPGAAMPGDGDDVVTLQDDGRFDGYGDARFGMSEVQVRKVWDGELNGGEEESERGVGSCFHLNPVDQPGIAYFAMMFEDDKFVRYSTSSDELTAPGGGRRGMDIQEIEALYPGRVEQRNHEYVEGGKYLRTKQADGNGIIVFETGPDGIVTEWRVGIAPQVDYSEGCA